MAQEPNKLTAEKVLTDLCDTIEDTGGVCMTMLGFLAPVADEYWGDLADVYMQACVVLKRTPMVDADD